MEGAMDGTPEGADIGREQAAASLAAAEGTAARMRRKASAYVVYCAVFGTAFPLGTATIGLASSQPPRVAAMTVMGLTLVFLLAFLFTRPVTGTWFAPVHTGAMLGWGLLYSVTMLVGVPVFPGEPAWWIPMSIATALPFAAAIAWILRTTRRDR